MFVMLFIVLSGVAIQQLQKSEAYRLTDETIERIDFNTLDMFKTDTDIYNFDLVNSVFFTESSTPLLHRHDSLAVEIRSLIKSVRQIKDFRLNDDLSRVEHLLRRYDSLFKELVMKLRHKGFKDYGLEGTFRTYAHALEDKKLISANEILMLRRYEKDYLLRGEKSYSDQLNTLSASLSKKYGDSRAVTGLIDNYTSTFNELVKVTEEIGFYKKGSLNDKLNTTTAQLLDALDVLNTKEEAQTAENHKKTFNMFMVVAAFATVFCGVVIYLTARML